MLNLFIGIIVDAVQSEQEAEQSEDRVRSAANFDTIMAELRSLRAEIAQLRQRSAGPAGDGEQSKLGLWMRHDSR